MLRGSGGMKIIERVKSQGTSKIKLNDRKIEELIYNRFNVHKSILRCIYSDIILIQ